MIHKPAGILVSGNRFRTIANALARNLTPSNQPGAVASQPIHRLDYGTTGILLIGKTMDCIRILNQMFEHRKITKTYYAVSIGNMNKNGTISSKIDGKDSQSEYQVIRSVTSEKYEKLNLVKLSPITGRRHQLRKHLAEIGNPILGDFEYGKAGLILKKKGIYLHAYSLTFSHPINQQRINCKSELPEKFVKILGDLSNEI